MNAHTKLPGTTKSNNEKGYNFIGLLFPHACLQRAAGRIFQKGIAMIFLKWLDWINILKEICIPTPFISLCLQETWYLLVIICAPIFYWTLNLKAASNKSIWWSVLYNKFKLKHVPFGFCISNSNHIRVGIGRDEMVI